MAQLIRCQIKKLFIKNGGLFVVLLYVVLRIFIGMLPTSSFESPAIRLAMSEYYQEYGGKLTEEKAVEIEDHYQQILNAESMWNSAVQDYNNQTITAEELQKIRRNVLDLKNEKRAFDKFFAYYQYCTEQPENRFLVDTQGWTTVMEMSNPDYLMILFSVFLIAMIDKADAGKNIALLLKTTQRGRGVHLLSKWVLAFISSVIILIASLSVDLILAANKYSLINYNVPLQSMSYFANSTYEISILQGFVLASVIQLLGLTCCNIMTVCLTEVCSNVVLGSFASLAISLLPYFVFNEDAKYLQLPFPTGLIQGSAYLHGVETGRMQTLNTALVIFLTMLLGLCVIGMYISLWKGKLKSKLITILLFPLVISLCGCSSNAPISMVYSEHDSLFLIETDDYYVYKQNEMMVKEKASGNEHPLLDDPLETDERKLSIHYIKEFQNTIYFMYLNDQNLQTIQSINLDTGERNIIFEEVSYGEEVMIFDVPVWQRPGMTYDQTCNLLKNFIFVNDELILLRGESITVVRNGREDILYEGRYWSTSSNGTKLYFINSERILCQLDLTTGTVIKYTNIMPTIPKAYGDKVLFLDPQNENALMCFYTTTSECEMLFPGKWSDFQYTDNYIVLKDSMGALWGGTTDSSYLRLIYNDADFYDYILNEETHSVSILLKDGTLQHISLDR